MDSKCYIGVDCGGTKLSSAVFDSQGHMIIEDKLLLKNASGKEVSDLMLKLILTMIDSAEKRHLDVLSIGICIPGIVYHENGNVWAPNIPGWDNYPLMSDLKKTINKDIRISIDSDRACYILGETWLGNAKGAQNAIFVAVGTGIGAGILIDGKILRGHGDIAGATGWLALQRPYDKKFDSCGNFEYFASGDGIARTAKEVIASLHDYKGKLNPESLRSEDVFEAYQHDDIAAIKTFDICIELWGMAVANYVSLFNPEKIIFGGGVFGPGAQFLPRIMEEAKNWAQPISINQVKLEVSALDKRAGLIGAGRLAMLNT
ncbi:MAG: ROK family protein [Candidatus Neomarinimicrobiota bacterium]